MIIALCVIVVLGEYKEDAGLWHLAFYVLVAERRNPLTYPPQSV